jgi:2-keto-4-pentenoate hydratase/2-oxohepta-3-ene-1,7-dioic acid hydratase in catechol pathway
MRILRFVDDSGKVRLGCDYRPGDQSASLLEGALFGELTDTGARASVTRLLAPLEPRAILCIGLNYRAHARETNADLPQTPVLFMKNPAALNHPGAPIVVPQAMVDQPQVDYEVELAVVIGRDARGVSEDTALDYVAGYTIGNDVSARRLQKEGGAGQWVKGKSLDTFCPLGPVLVTADELADPQSLELATLVNGRVMQQSNTSDMIFPAAHLIAELSRDMTLMAGTVILTGTPSGVGVARDPQVFLKPGDQVVCTIDRIGELVNPVVAGT